MLADKYILLEVTGKPKAIFLAGPAGSGKSYTIKQLLPVDKYEIINVDDTYPIEQAFFCYFYAVNWQVLRCMGGIISPVFAN